jgi:hypothetical protein
LINKFIIKPKIIINKDLKNSEALKNIVEYQTNLFTSFYSLSFKTMVELYGVEPDIAFNLLSSETVYSSTDILRSGMEESEYKIDFVDHGVEESAFGLEEANDFLIAGLEAKGDKKNKKSSGHGEAVKISKDLKTGKIDEVYVRRLDMTISSRKNKKKTITFEVLIYAGVKFVNSNTMKLLYTKEDSQSPLDRLDDLQAGSISFWSDFVFAQDMIRDYKQRRLNDKEDVLRELRKREISSTIKRTQEGYAGFNRYYQMLVLTNDDLTNIRNTFRGTLNKARVKNEFLRTTSSFSATVIDDLRERVYIYINGIESDLDIRFKDLEKKSSSDKHMEELLKVLGSSRMI